MGYPVPVGTVEASKRLCSTLLQECGGSSAVANSLNFNRQYVHRWIERGYVPLVQVWNVSTLLDISAWALSYYKLAEVFGETSPSIESVMKDLPLTPATKKAILKLI